MNSRSVPSHRRGCSFGVVLGIVCLSAFLSVQVHGESSTDGDRSNVDSAGVGVRSSSVSAIADTQSPVPSPVSCGAHVETRTSPWERWAPFLVSSFIGLLALLTAVRSLRSNEKKATREATEKTFQEWHGEDMREMRKFMFYDFLKNHRAKLNGVGMKKTEARLRQEGVSEKDAAKVNLLCSFFNRVGLLGSAGLVDVDFILGPMQHSLRRAWWIMESPIRRERGEGGPGELDPIYMFGFEWLYRRSQMRGKHQADLLARHSNRKPRLLTNQELSQLRQQIERNEARFRNQLPGDETEFPCKKGHAS
jgi:hypothetical protein